MLPNRVTAKQARDNFTDILGMVYYGDEPVVVGKKGRLLLSLQKLFKFKNFSKEL